MATVHDVLQAIESLAPSRFAFGFDSVGLQVGDPAASVTSAVVSLDRSLGAIEFARSLGAELLVAHHPLFFDPMPRLTTRSHQERTAIRLIETGMACIAAHTNWDSARGGVNDALAARLGLVDVRSFGSAASVEMRKLVVTVPSARAAAVAQAAGDAGAGLIGNYTHCAFRSEGVGQFLPTEGAHPAIGAVGRFEEVAETRIEMTCRAELVGAVNHAIRTVHPYEEPAIDVYVLNEAFEQPAGRVGELSQPMSLAEFATYTDRVLGTRSWAWGDPERSVRTVAVVGGAADGEGRFARSAGADVFLTGEVKQHIALEASESGLPIIAAGHYATEQPGVEALAVALAGTMPQVRWEVFTPPPGHHGRPL
ncbi:MAG: Nif3-like dinuclear metal center hexameric protein [Methanoregulaceae archaeon]|nr:Nif3-like dinuclear metal center hexameric protein [Methanoregulaceae archaeon]